ncbi:MAG: hypothetical protein A3A33_04980 [Candidatus Yanofskybacteria bacterium RIFCSPLOWO2_01_FULL_49_25]|uniref:Uncharacterized protein n=1 Tax=Candidatus Yanofskybacteria bacterium RIFCSPLOWO2_01_FULL_49_25 TaxID=1802701 RepID=A0A1F8GQ51_9BACT|nr:MAG: hypothetical protein A3A33_04980 [Candidatus Yanofskybacteria bacterium RIFCSPLOWO2_01_FULL_49_25]
MRHSFEQSGAVEQSPGSSESFKERMYKKLLRSEADRTKSRSRSSDAAAVALMTMLAGFTAGIAPKPAEARGWKDAVRVELRIGVQFGGIYRNRQESIDIYFSRLIAEVDRRIKMERAGFNDAIAREERERSRIQSRIAQIRRDERSDLGASMMDAASDERRANGAMRDAINQKREEQNKKISALERAYRDTVQNARDAYDKDKNNRVFHETVAKAGQDRDSAISDVIHTTEKEIRQLQDDNRAAQERRERGVEERRHSNDAAQENLQGDIEQVASDIDGEVGALRSQQEARIMALNDLKTGLERLRRDAPRLEWQDVNVGAVAESLCRPLLG